MSHCYIAGPMSGIPDHNYPAFDAAAAELRAEGWTVHSPADMSREAGHAPNSDGSISLEDWQMCMRMDLVRIIESCEAIFALPNWWRSKGARLEIVVAQSCGIPVYFFETREQYLVEVVTTRTDFAA